MQNGPFEILPSIAMKNVERCWAQSAATKISSRQPSKPDINKTWSWVRRGGEEKEKERGRQ